MSTPDQTPVEHAGHWVDANIWFHLGLNKTEAAALKAAAKRLLPAQHRTSARAAYWLLRAALAHFDQLYGLLSNDLRYAEAEGLSFDRYLESLAARALGSAPKCERDGRSRYSCRIEVEVGGHWRPYFEAVRAGGLVPMREEGKWHMPRRAVSVLRRVQAQFPQHRCRIHNDGVCHFQENLLNEGRQP